MTRNQALTALAALRHAGSGFSNSITDQAVRWRQETGSPALSNQERKMLRGEGVGQIAEFFFLVRELTADGPAPLRPFLKRHNDDMREMIGSCERGYTKFGLSQQRLKGALFTDKQIDLILHESEAGRPTFDQRSVAKILVQFMSFESCRALLVLLDASGFLHRNDFGTLVLVSARDEFVDSYRSYLDALFAAINQP